MSITDPTQLVAEFKKSGEFDRLRRELLSEFKDDDSITTFMYRVQDIVQQRLREDERLQYLPPETVHNELMQDMDRFPLVQRAVTEIPALSGPSFGADIRRSLAKLLNEGPGAFDSKQLEQKITSNGDAELEDSESSGSDSDSSGDEHDIELDHDASPNEMPQNDRFRQSSNDVKQQTTVNGVHGPGHESSPPTSPPQ